MLARHATPADLDEPPAVHAPRRARVRRGLERERRRRRIRIDGGLRGIRRARHHGVGSRSGRQRLRPRDHRQRGGGPASPKCPAGLTGNPVPAFCIKLPAAYKVKDARITPAKGSIAYDTGTPTDNLMISYDDSAIAQLTKDVTGEMKFGGDKLEKSGDLPGGGKWFNGSHQDFERVVTLVKGPAAADAQVLLHLQAQERPPKDAIDACRSIVLP